MSEPSWNCAWDKDICNCHIDFTIKNNTREKYTLKYVVRSQERRRAVKGPAIQIIGLHEYESEIDAHGIFSFSENYKYNMQPDKMIVTIVNRKII